MSLGDYYEFKVFAKILAVLAVGYFVQAITLPPAIVFEADTGGSFTNNSL